MAYGPAVAPPPGGEEEDVQEALVPLRQRSTRSGTASVCLGDSHVSVTHGPDSDTPVRREQIHFSAIRLD